MICAGCGTSYYAADAKAAFNSNYNYDLSYDVEITGAVVEDNLCGDCAIDFMETKIRSQEGYVEIEQKENEQSEIVNQLVGGFETLSEEEFDGLYEQLDIEHQMEVDRKAREFADDAVGDEHWDSDN